MRVEVQRAERQLDIGCPTRVAAGHARDPDAVAALLVLIATASASAHALLLESTPKADTTVTAPSQIVLNIQTARRLGAEGVLLFSYDSLARSEYLGELGRAAFVQ